MVNRIKNHIKNQWAHLIGPTMPSSPSSGSVMNCCTNWFHHVACHVSVTECMHRPIGLNHVPAYPVSLGNLSRGSCGCSRAYSCLRVPAPPTAPAQADEVCTHAVSAAAAAAACAMRVPPHASVPARSFLGTFRACHARSPPPPPPPTHAVPGWVATVALTAAGQHCVCALAAAAVCSRRGAQWRIQVLGRT
jgi:hypothetical protein